MRWDDKTPEHPKMAAAGGDAGWLHFCAVGYCNRNETDGVIPYAAVESAKQKLSSPRRLSQRADEKFAEALAREVEQVAVEVRGLFGSTRIPFARMLDLQIGDVVLLDTDEGRPVPVIVQGREKLRATPTVSGGSIAMIVDQPLRAPAQTPSTLMH